MNDGEPTRTPAPAGLKYERVLIPGGWEKMREWKPIEEQDGWRKVGKCPRCGHRTDKFFPDMVVRLEIARAVAAPKVASNVVECNCLHEHPERKAGDAGCGAYWGITTSREQKDEG